MDLNENINHYLKMKGALVHWSFNLKGVYFHENMLGNM